MRMRDCVCIADMTPVTALINTPTPSCRSVPNTLRQAPKMIEDAAAVKPSGWKDDAAFEIPDPEALKPEDWDDEEVSRLRVCVICLRVCVWHDSCCKQGCGAVWRCAIEWDAIGYGGIG